MCDPILRSDLGQNNDMTLVGLRCNIGSFIHSIYV
jgi:hypothetical protein